jgi:hypothetical protein
MSLPVSVKLSSIYCRDEADGIGDAEPYLWAILFKIDGETIRQAPGLPLLVGDAVFHFGPGSHGNLGTRSVDAGETVQIPAAIGEWHTGLQPIILTQDSTTIPVPGKQKPLGLCGRPTDNPSQNWKGRKKLQQKSGDQDHGPV